MKIYVSADMEGAAGVTEYNEIDASNPRYVDAREWLTENVNAAIDGALDAGATEILVNDSHGGGPNIPFDKIHPKAKLFKGRLGRPLLNVARIDESFAGVFFIGFHARLGQPGIISHTFNHSAGFIDIKINGKSVGEGELAAAVAGTFGVPVVLGTGDDRFCQEMRSWNPKAETVTVKTAISWQDGICLSLEEANSRIREAASQAVTRRKEIPPFTFDLPVDLEMECANDAIALTIALIPGVELSGHRTVVYSSSDYLEFYRALQAMVLLQLTAIFPDLLLPQR